MKLSRKKLFLIFLLCSCLFVSWAQASFSFHDDRFRNDLTTENLDAIIEEYDLYDGWYWTTPANVIQDFHGHPESPGWNTTVEEKGLKNYLSGWYGCRWPIDHVRKTAPDQGGYAECFAFAQFIGYLLSGEKNPQHNWKFYYSKKGKTAVEASSGLCVGDIVRVEYKKNNHEYHHSAVVYSVNGDEILFMQVSGGSYNRISVAAGFSDGYFENVTSLDEISAFPGLKISRYQPDK